MKFEVGDRVRRKIDGALGTLLGSVPALLVKFDGSLLHCRLDPDEIEPAPDDDCDFSMDGYQAFEPTKFPGQKLSLEIPVGHTNLVVSPASWPLVLQIECGDRSLTIRVEEPE